MIVRQHIQNNDHEFVIVQNEPRKTDVYQHLADNYKGQHDAQTLDSATAEQASQQEGSAFPELQSDEEEGEEEMTEASLLWKEREQNEVMTQCLSSLPIGQFSLAWSLILK